jgi:hypothetical protein
MLTTVVPHNQYLSFSQVVTAIRALSHLNLFQHQQSIKIMQEAYAQGLDAYEHNLRGILVLYKEDKPYTSKDITTKLQKQWNTSGK